MHCWRLPALRWHPPPALCWHHFQHCAVAVDGVAPVLLPSVRRHLCPHHAPLAVAFALLPSSLYVVSSPYPVSLAPALRFCHLMPWQQCLCLFCHDVVVGASHGSCRRLGQGPHPGNSGLSHLVFSSNRGTVVVPIVQVDCKHANALPLPSRGIARILFSWDLSGSSFSCAC
jgi:hypothetical protein